MAENKPGLFEVVKTYQNHSHSRTCRKYNKDQCRFLYGHFFIDKAIVKPLETGKHIAEKNEILMWRKTLLK